MSFGAISYVSFIATLNLPIANKLETAQFNDAIQSRAIVRNRGRFEPESRLWAIYFSAVVMCLGISLLGVALENRWHWSLVGFFWGLFVFAVMTSTVIISGTYPNLASSLMEKLLNRIQRTCSTVFPSNRPLLLRCSTSPVFSSASQLCCTKLNGEKR